MKKLLLFVAFALLASVIFAQDLKTRVGNEVTRTEQRANKFQEMISNIENRVGDHEKGAQFVRLMDQLNNVDRQIVLLYNNLMMPVGPNRYYPPVQTRATALTSEEAKDVESKIKAKVDEYNQLRQQLQQFNNSL
jgi:hypothetical protein